MEELNCRDFTTSQNNKEVPYGPKKTKTKFIEKINYTARFSWQTSHEN